MSDLPIEEIAAMAERQIENGMTIWQKWTCAHCGARQTMDTPNVLYRSGRCQECDKVSVIVVCGFMLTNDMGAEVVAAAMKEA